MRHITIYFPILNYIKYLQEKSLKLGTREGPYLFSGDARTPLTPAIASKIFWKFTLDRMIFRLKLHAYFLHY